MYIKSIKNYFIVGVLTLALISCGSNLPGDVSKWHYADLRLLDPIDSSMPPADIQAIYLRRGDDLPHGTSLQIRLDMLEVKLVPSIDFYIVIDLKQGGTIDLPINANSNILWDLLICIKSSGEISVTESNLPPHSMIPVVVLRDSLLDTVIINLSLDFYDKGMDSIKVQAFTTLANSNEILDQIEPAYKSKIPPDPIKTVIAFWNSFPVYTPIQAMRRWDGAHTGPLGGHHGLYNLIKTSQNHKIPIFLLDLVNPTSLYALDYVGVLEMFKRNQQENLMILPDTGIIYPPSLPYQLPNTQQQKLLSFNQQIRNSFGLPPSSFYYSTIKKDFLLDPSNSRYPIIFIPTNADDSNVKSYRFGASLFIPIPLITTDFVQTDLTATEDIPASLKFAISNAIDKTQSNSNNRILVLGGNLPASFWGDPQIARSSFLYIKNRPWLHILDANDLLLLANSHMGENDNKQPVMPPLLEGYPSLSEDQIKLIQDLEKIKQSDITKLAWDTLFSLLGPTYPDYPGISKLRNAYWPLIGIFMKIGQWQEYPHSIYECDRILIDIPTCSLASNNFFLLINQNDGSILLAFTEQNGKVHQIIGTNSQLASGVRDPSLWDINQGINAEPSALTGTSPIHINNETVQIRENFLQMEDEAGIRITYSISAYSFEINYETLHPITIPLQFVLDPWLRESPGWVNNYASQVNTDGFDILIRNNFQIKVTTNAKFNLHSFLETRERIGFTEDPNAEKSVGDYLPFPMFVGSFSNPDSFEVSISVRNVQ